MGESLSEVAIIGKDDESLGILIQSAYVVKMPECGRDELINSIAL